MTYSGTNKDIYVVDTNGHHERLTTYLTYDKAHMSSNQPNLPPMVITLQQQRYHMLDIRTHRYY